jgi:hypothetical protein
MKSRLNVVIYNAGNARRTLVRLCEVVEEVGVRNADLAKAVTPALNVACSILGQLEEECEARRRALPKWPPNSRHNRRKRADDEANR